MAAIAAAIDSIRVDLGGTGSVANAAGAARRRTRRRTARSSLPEPSYGSRPRQGGSGSGRGRAPGRTPAPLPRHDARAAAAAANDARAALDAAHARAGGARAARRDIGRVGRSCFRPATIRRAPGPTAARDSAADAPCRGLASVSTLRGTAGELERGRGPRQGGGPDARPPSSPSPWPRPRRWSSRSSSSRRRRPVRRAETTPPAAVEAPRRRRASSAPPTPRAPPAAEPAVEAQPPGVAATVVVKIASDPPGAAVIDTAHGQHHRANALRRRSPARRADRPRCRCGRAATGRRTSASASIATRSST